MTTTRYTLTLPGTAQAPEAFRRWVRGHLTEHKLPDWVIGNAALITSELATNSFRHTPAGAPEGKVDLELWIGPTHLRIHVTDPGADTAPTARRADQIDLWAGAGLGLLLVETFCDRWWVRDTLISRTTSAEICHDPASPLVDHPMSEQQTRDALNIDAVGLDELVDGGILPARFGADGVRRFLYSDVHQARRRKLQAAVT